MISQISLSQLSTPNKSCELDPITTFLLKYCLPTLIVPITKKINLSQTSGIFPSHFKHAHSIPLLNKSSLPANDVNSLRLIYNLSFISKVLEKAVSCRLNVQLNCNHLSNMYTVFIQTISIYRKRSTKSSLRHSTKH